MLKSGAIGEIAAVKRFLEDGYEVYSSVSDNSKYDMLLSKDSNTFRVEVKSTRTLRNGKYVVQLKSIRSNKTKNVIKNFDNSQLDFLVVYIEPEDKIIIFDAKEISQKCEMLV